MSRRFVLVLLVVFAIVIIGMLVTYASLHAIPNEYHISGISFIEQETNWCGPASLTMVLNYWGDLVNQSEVGSAIDPEHEGTDAWQLITFLESRGYVVYEFDRNSLKYRSSALNELEIWVSHDYPIVVAQWMWFPESVWHYRVVVGYDTKNIYVTDPFGSSITFSIETFLQLWDTNEYGLVVVGDPTKDSDGDQLTDCNEVLENTDPFSYFQPFPTWIITAIVIVAVVGTALLVYLAKVKKKLRKSNSNAKFPSFFILPLFMIATLLAVIAYRRKHSMKN